VFNYIAKYYCVITFVLEEAEPEDGENLVPETWCVKLQYVRWK